MKVTMADPRDFIPSKYKQNSTTANNSSDDSAQIDSLWSDLAKPSSPMTPREHVLDSIPALSENTAVKTENVVPTFTSTQKVKSKNGLKNKLSAALVVLLLLAGVTVSAFMAQKSQENRQQASTGAGASCIKSADGVAPFNKKHCDCDGDSIWFDNTGFCADQAGDGETTGEYGSDDGSAEQGLCAVYYKYGCTDTIPPSTTPGDTNYNGCWTCGANGCSIKTGTGFEHCAAGCDVWKWRCDRIDNLSGGCQDGQPSIGNSQSFSASCGAEQIDVQCGGQSRDFRSRINDEPCDTSITQPPEEPPSEPPTTEPPQEEFSCVNIEMLNADNMLMSGDDDEDLREGDIVRFRASSSDDDDDRITFEFRILPPNTTEWVNLTMGTTTATNRNTSGPYTIISSGSHTAQSRICISGACQEWENLGDATTVFSDVPLSHWAYTAITTLYRSGVTAGCGTNPLRFCPEQTIYRSQTATLVMRAKYGETFFSSYTLPSTATFADVPLTHAQVKYVEKMYDDGITAGCSTNPLNFCPNRATTRAEAAIMIMRAKYGANYSFTNPATSTFADVPADAGYRKYVEQMFADGITAGCSQNPRNFCPTREVTRAEVAQMIYKAFNLDEN